jgi:hypothetical protein
MENVLIETKASPKDRSVLANPPHSLPAVRWRWLIVACVLLGISGAFRYWRDWQFESTSRESETPPFHLDEIPKTLGSWHAVEGMDETLEPEVQRIAGATDYISRMYKDEKSGQTALVLVLYGLAQMVHAHTPDVCYPSAGFSLVANSESVVRIPIPETRATAPFRRETFKKSKAGQQAAEEVYFSFLNNDQWDFNMARHWKRFRLHPGMFKVQIQSRASGLGQIENTPVNELLSAIVGQIEQRLKAGGQAGEPREAPDSTASASPSAPAS